MLALLLSLALAGPVEETQAEEAALIGTWRATQYTDQPHHYYLKFLPRNLVLYFLDSEHIGRGKWQLIRQKDRTLVSISSDVAGFKGNPQHLTTIGLAKTLGESSSLADDHFAPLNKRDGERLRMVYERVPRTFAKMHRHLDFKIDPDKLELKEGAY